MVLQKRYRRDIRHNLSLYISATLLTVLSLLLFYLYHICGVGILDYTEQIFDSQKIEDANFSTYLEIPEEEIRALEKKYNLILEKQKYINIETNGVQARVFERTEKIDIPYVTKGRDVSSDNEIILSEGYAQNVGLHPGDTVQIRDQHYTISGFAERPDYLYMLQNLSDSYKNITSFYICYMTEDAFEALGEKNCQYLVRYGVEDTEKQKAFRRDVHEHYIMSSYAAAENNYRISMVVSQPELFLQMAYVILFTLPLLAVLLISIILSRKIRKEQRMIGTLAANGYSPRQIIWHYAGFSALPGLLGGVVTTIVVLFTADAYGSLGLMDYEPMDVRFTLQIPQMLLGLIVPTAMYVLSSVITVRRLLKHDITELLAGTAEEKNRVHRFLAGKKASFRIKFSVRSIVGNPGRSFALFLGVFLGSFITLFALGDQDSIMNISDETAAGMERYSYQYILNELREEKPAEGETLLSASLEDESGKILSLTGADGNSLIGLKDLSGNPVEADDGYLISSLYATTEGLAKGDTLQVMNPLSAEEFTITVSGIVQNDFARAVYTSRKNVSRLTGIDEGLYNTVLSRKKLDIPEKSIITLVEKEKIADQYQAVFDQMEVLIYLMVGIGLALCVISVYIAVGMIIHENKAAISMLRVLGYSTREINRLLLNDHIYMAAAGILLSIPSVFWVEKAMFLSFVDILGYLIEVHIKPSSYLLAVGLVLVTYFVSLWWAGRKTAKVDMAESLKDNRE